MVQLIGAPFEECGRMYTQKIEGFTVPADGYLEVMNLSGAGYVDFMFMSLFCLHAPGRQNTKVQMFVDGETTPSIDVYLVDLCCCRGLEALGGTGGSQASYVSLYTGYTSLAFSGGVDFKSYMLIPFHTSIRVVFVNGSTTTPVTLGGYIQYHLKDDLDWGRYKYAHAVSLPLAGITTTAYENKNLLVIPEGKRGAFHGCYLYFNPVQTNFHYQEGNIRLYIDGDLDGYPSIHYDSTEDYFLFGWYFWHPNETRNVIAPFFGCTRKDEPDIIGAYRWHINDRIIFDNGFRFEWQNGDPNAINNPVSTNTVVNGVLWYYTDSQ